MQSKQRNWNDIKTAIGTQVQMEKQGYQIMREADLKLEKMAALIPTKKARKEIAQYFADRKKET